MSLFLTEEGKPLKKSLQQKAQEENYALFQLTNIIAQTGSMYKVGAASHDLDKIVLHAKSVIAAIKQRQRIRMEDRKRLEALAGKGKKK